MKTLKKHILYITLVILVAIGTVASLAWAALKSVNSLNGFNRNIKSVDLKIVNEISRNEFIEDIVEIGNNKMVFKTKEPDQLFITDDSLQNGYISTLPLPNNSWTKPNSLTFINRPNVIVFPNNSSIIISSELKSYNTTIRKLPIQAFIKVVPISSSSYVFRTFDKIRNNNLGFVKINTNSDSTTYENDSSTSITDEGINTDGHLLFDKKTQLLVYVNIYNNQYKVIDTSLTLKYVGRTIDTVSHAALKTGNVQGDYVTNTGPSRVINEFAATYEGKILVMSKLKADNETTDDLGKNIPVEVYDIDTGKYEFSFYLPNYRGKKPLKFKVQKNRLVVIYEDFVVAYSHNI